MDYCHGILLDDKMEGVLIYPNNHKNNYNLKKRQLDLNIHNILLPINNTEKENEYEDRNPFIFKNENKNNGNNIRKKLIHMKKESNHGREKGIPHSISKTSFWIEGSDEKSKILEKEKNEIQKENTLLLKQIDLYRDTISRLKNNTNDSSYYNNYESSNKKENEQIKIIFLFKNNENIKGINNDTREEIFGYRYEMFLEVKLRLINLKHLHPTDIKTCYYNSKEINDWLTLEELNITNNSYVICQFA